MNSLQSVSTRAKSPLSKAPTHDNKQPTVLFIDDNAEIVDAIATLFRVVGVQARCEHNCHDALALFDTGLRPQVVVANCRLPDGTGIELIRKVRRKATSHSVSAVLMTGDLLGKTREDGNADPGSYYELEKPIIPNELLSLIDKLAA